MNPTEKERFAKLLKESLPKVSQEGTQLSRDLWPPMLQRLQRPAAAPTWFNQIWFNQTWFNRVWFNEKWFDWALGAAVVAWMAFFPAAIPLLLYHL